MRTYPDPTSTVGKWTGSGHADLDELAALRAENARLRRGVGAIRDFAGERLFTVYSQDVYRMCNELLKEKP